MEYTSSKGITYLVYNEWKKLDKEKENTLEGFLENENNPIIAV
jgi:hypothetical protein